LNKKEIIRKAVESGISRYINECRDNIPEFCEQTFSLSGAWDINKKAFGKDILKAPANVVWTPFYFLGTGLGKGLKKLNLNKASEALANLPAGFTTDVELEVQWRIYTQFIKLPFKQEEREFTENRLLEIILEDENLAPIIEESMESISSLTSDDNGKNLLTERIFEYTDSRKAASELSSTLIGTATGYLTSKSLNFGAIGLGQSLAASAAYHSAVSTFAFGNTLGAAFYSVVPVSASTGAVILSTGGIAAVLGTVSAFAGVIADPIQHKLGLHEKKLNKLVDALESQFKSNEQSSLDIKDGYAARVLDVLDFLTMIVRK
jgi:hypothetical protein